MSTQYPSRQAIRAVAVRLIDYLNEYGAWTDMVIYAGRYSFSPLPVNPDASTKQIFTRKRTMYYMTRNVDVRAFIEHADSRTINITLGPKSCRTMNNLGRDFLYETTQKFIAKYDLYFEFHSAFEIVSYHV